MAKDFKDYTLGRGRVLLSRFVPGTQKPSGFLYMGNTPEFNLTIESDNLDHFSSDEGIREKDDGVTLEVTRSGSIITDNIAPDNVAYFFFGETQTITTASAALSTSTIEGVRKDYSYLVGATDINPVGVRGINPVDFEVRESGGLRASGTLTFTANASIGDTVTINGQVYTFQSALAVANDVLLGSSAARTAANLVAAINGAAGVGVGYAAGTVANAGVTAAATTNIVTLTARLKGTAGNAITLVENGTNTTVSGATLAGGTASGALYVIVDDYTINYDTGRLTIVATGAIADDSDIDVAYSLLANTRERVISGTDPVEGALMYEANNPKGKQIDYYMPYIQISPNGDYSLKGDEWQQIPFTLQILKPKSGGAAILADGRPVYA
jgi:hypothetical protein